MVRSRPGGSRRRRSVVRAVDAVSVLVARRRAVGYIGANGAGKSTTIKMLTGILTPTAGSVRTCGLEPLRQRRRAGPRGSGSCSGSARQLWWDLPLGDSFGLLARDPPAVGGAVRGRAGTSSSTGWTWRRSWTTPVRQLSLGQRMRGEIAAALLHGPELLVLDEPTVGLDVLSKERLRLFLREERAEHGRTLLLTTHDMGDVERLCERILVVDRGRLAYDGDLAGLVRGSGAQRVLPLDLTEPAQPLDGIAGTRLVGVEAGGLRQRLALAAGTTAAQVLPRSRGRVAGAGPGDRGAGHRGGRAPAVRVHRPLTAPRRPGPAGTSRADLSR